MGQRTVVVRAVRADGEDLVARACEDDLRFADAAQQSAAVFQIACRDACREIRLRVCFRIAHAALRARKRS
jgi:hypothetical protein